MLSADNGNLLSRIQDKTPALRIRTPQKKSDHSFSITRQFYKSVSAEWSEALPYRDRNIVIFSEVTTVSPHIFPSYKRARFLSENKTEGETEDQTQVQNS